VNTQTGTKAASKFDCSRKQKKTRLPLKDLSKSIEEVRLKFISTQI
jgi:hypothetical protein